MAYTDIDDSSAHFQVTLYTGNSSNLTVTNDGNSDLKPDLVWTKKRSDTSHHALVDSSRGATKQIYTNLTAAEETVSGVTAFNTDGFTLGSNGTANLNGATFVAWQWKMNGGTTVSNTDGNITSTVQANTTAGQSIVTWTGNEQSTATVGHGLDKTPETIIYKRRNNGTYNWTAHLLQLGSLSNGNTYGGYPNLTNSWEQTTQPAPTATIFKPTNGAPTNSGTMLAYCFHSVKGYSRMGVYMGNGNGNGPFAYTGFKPAFIMLKGNQTNHWVIYDHKRPGFNNKNYELHTNLTAAEYTGASYYNMDIYSNGFKPMLTDPSINGAGAKYAYMAFAENPFVTSTGVPTTAR
jgi:hypothetical protein